MSGLSILCLIPRTTRKIFYTHRGGLSKRPFQDNYNHHLFHSHMWVIPIERLAGQMSFTFPHAHGGLSRVLANQVIILYLFPTHMGWGYPDYPVKLHCFQIFSLYIGGYPASRVVFILVSVFSHTYCGYPKYLLLLAKEQIFSPLIRGGGGGYPKSPL